MNLKRIFLSVGFALMLATALTLRAQTGCDDSAGGLGLDAQKPCRGCPS
jgi:hypothetical protein